MALTRITKGVIKPNENYDTHNINSTGIITAVGANFTGDVSVGGVLTYEDVTSIDSVGIITAQQGIHVGAGVSAVGVGTFGGLDIGGDIDVDGHTNLDNVSVAGLSTFSGSIHLGFGIIHEGDTNTRISFGPNDNIKLTANNTDRIHVEDDKVNLYGTTDHQIDSSHSGSHNYVARFRNSTTADTIVRWHNTNSENAIIEWNDNGSTANAGNLIFRGFNDAGEGARFDTDGNFLISKDLDVDGHTNLDNVSIAGVSTFTGDLTVDTNTFHVDSTNNRVGVGIITPARKLQIHQSDSTANYLHVTNDTTGSGVSDGALFGINSLEEAVVWNQENDNIIFGTNNTHRLTLDNSGHLVPYTDSTFDLGTSSKRFRNFYADTLYGDGSNLTGITQTTINSNVNNYLITGTGTANTLQGESNLTFDGAELDLNNSGGSARLYLVSGNSADSSIYFGRQNDGATGGIRYEHTDNSLQFMGYNNTERLRITSSGGLIKYGNNINLNSAYIDFSGSISTPATAAAIYRPADNTLAFSTANNERLRITSDGKVLIGNGSTYTPSGMLHIVGDNNSNGPELYLMVPNNNVTDNIGALVFGNNVDKSVVKIQGVTHTANNTGDLTFHTSTTGTMTEKVRITSDGRMGVGNNNPQFMIHTEGSGNNGGVRIENSHTTTTVSGNTASGAFPHNLLLSNYGGSGNSDNRLVSLGFDVPTTGNHANAAIVYQATASNGTGDLQFWLENGNTIYERLRITSRGHLVTGAATPPNQAANDGSVFLKGDATLGYLSQGGSLTFNAYYNGGWKYVSNGAAHIMWGDSGGINFSLASSGTAGNGISFSRALKIHTNNRISIGDGNNTTPLGALHINTKATVGTDTALFIGSNSDLRYMTINQNSNTEQFSHMELVYNDNGSRSVLQLKNPYAPAGYGSAINWKGYNNGDQGWIECKSEGANSANATMYLNSTNGTFLQGNSNRHVRMPQQPSFAAYYNGSVWNVNGNYMVFNTTRHNIGNHYDTSNGRFTAPIAGSYQINFYSIYRGSVTNAYVQVYVNGARIYGGDNHFTNPNLGSNWETVSYCQVLYLNSGDYVQMYSPNNIDWHGNHWQCFSGWLLG